MRVGFIVCAHRGPEQVALLLSVLRHPRARSYLHVDSRVAFEPFARALAQRDVTGLTFLERRETRWGGIEVVDAALDGLAHATSDGCDYVMLLSGQDFPLRPLDELLEFVEAAGSRSYVRHWPLPTSRWRFEGRDRTDFYTYTVRGRRETCIPRGEDTSALSWKGRSLNEALRLRTALKPARRHPAYARSFGGHQWWNLSREAATYVLRFVEEHPDYRRYHEHTVLPDELFFQSILVGTDFGRTHEIVDDSLRFMRWAKGESHPRALTVDDLAIALAGGDLFARKFESESDPAVLARLVEHVRA
jgi:core-2/I-Branching enzyme